MKHYLVKNFLEEKVVGNLLKECQVCLNLCDSPGKKIETCPKYGTSRRQGSVTNNKGTTFLCCDTTKTTKLFREKVEALSYAYHDLVEAKTEVEDDVKKAEQLRVNRLIHNLTSINAHNIQEIYDLVPQEVLASDHKNQIAHIVNELRRNPNKAALMFIRIAKHNIHMKSEFSIYKKLDRSDAKLDQRTHPIRKVVLNVLHTFFVDFSNNNIFVEVEENRDSVIFDYESIQVALYHLIENSSKYTKKNSIIKIYFIKNGFYLDVIFEMVSLYIEIEERDKIFIEGYSGKNAKKTNKSGDGIGMWRIDQMMKINGGEVKVVAGTETEDVMGYEYAKNKFILSFKRN